MDASTDCCRVGAFCKVDATLAGAGVALVSQKADEAYVKITMLYSLGYLVVSGRLIP